LQKQYKLLPIDKSAGRRQCKYACPELLFFPICGEVSKGKKETFEIEKTIHQPFVRQG
jgi:hypothetical protein